MNTDSALDFEKRVAPTKQFDCQLSLQKRKAIAHEVAQAKVTTINRKLKVGCTSNSLGYFNLALVI
jgi:hypothetical protein